MRTEYAKELPPEWKELDKFFSALRDPTRQKLILLFDGDEEISPKDICHLFSCSHASLTDQFRILRNAGIVTGVKRHKNIMYRLNRAFLQRRLIGVAGLENLK